MIKHWSWFGAAVAGLVWSSMQAQNRVPPVSTPSLQEYTDRTEWTLPHERPRQLVLEMAAGNARVSAGGGDRIHLVATRVVRAERAEAAQAFFKRMQISQRPEADRLVIDASWPAPASREVGSPHVNFEVQVPRGLNLQVQTGSGSIEAAGVGEAHLRTGGGNVICRDLKGPLEVDTASGSIEVSDGQGARLRTGGGNIQVQQLHGRLDAQTASGSIRVEKVAGPVTAHTGGGNVTVTEAQNSVQATSGSGSIAVALSHGPEAVDIELSTRSGNLDLRLPEMVSARVEADSSSGVIDLQLPPGVRIRRDRTHMEATLGSGSGSIHLYTGSGAIRIRTDPAH